MSTLEDLKKYLVGDGGYLLNDDNNGKTVMLSGAWGSRKTHFWENDIELKLSEKLKENNKACVYVSLYGKDNIEAIKSEILQKAYSEIKEENIKQAKAISVFGMGTKILAGISIFGVKVDAQDISDSTKNHYDMKKIEDSTEFLSDGGLICFDDFERKSKKIDLNDLFGFISQLAIDMKCKVVIVLNSDVFEGKEANVFKTVKEKTVNKFFYFEPSINELFESIYKSDDKYKRLDGYKKDILKAILETEELNARIYIQVLDNCLEWIDKGYDSIVLRALVLGTFNFILNHIIFDYIKPMRIDKNNERYEYKYKEINFGIKLINDSFRIIDNSRYSNVKLRDRTSIPSHTKEEDFINFLIDKNVDRVYLKENKKKIEALWKYGYRLNYVCSVDLNIYKEIAQFIKSGILLIKDEKKLS